MFVLLHRRIPMACNLTAHCWFYNLTERFRSNWCVFDPWIEDFTFLLSGVLQKCQIWSQQQTPQVWIRAENAKHSSLDLQWWNVSWLTHTISANTHTHTHTQIEKVSKQWADAAMNPGISCLFTFTLHICLELTNHHRIGPRRDRIMDQSQDVFPTWR